MDGTQEKQDRLKYLNDMAKKYLMDYFRFINAQGGAADQAAFITGHLNPGVAASNLKAAVNTGDARTLRHKLPPDPKIPKQGMPGSVWREWDEMLDIRRRSDWDKIQRTLENTYKKQKAEEAIQFPKTKLLGPQQGVVPVLASTAIMKASENEEQMKRAEKIIENFIKGKYMIGGELNPIKTPPSGGP